MAARATIGVAIPLVVGQLSGHPVAGTAAAVGALQAGFASFQGTYRSRAGVVVAASIGMALSVVVGATLGHVLGVDMLLVSLWAFAAGMLVALGQAAAVVGIQAVVVLVVYSQFTLTPAAALRQAALVVAGGAIQILLIIVVWPFRRYPAERRALSHVYAQLAEYARRIISGGPSGPAAALADLPSVLHDPQPFGGSIETAAHNGLANEAERIQLELTALSRAKQRLSGLGAADAAAAVNEMAGAAEAALAELARSLLEARSPSELLARRNRFAAALQLINPGSADRGGAADEDRWVRAARTEAYERAQALAGQLRAAMRIAAVPADADTGPTDTGQAVDMTGRRKRAPSLQRVRDQLTILRANLTFSSQVCRHAVRLAVTLAVAVGAADLIDLPHHYWLPLTVMIVLKPDFSSTFTRGFNRIAGTLIGAGVVTIAIAEIRPGSVGLTILVSIFAFGAYSVLFANYAIYSVCIASLVVTLLAFTGAPAPSLALDRVVYTVVGSGLALLAYAVWPTWERTALPGRLATLVDTAADYGQAVFDAWVNPAGANRDALQQKRLAARLARSNAEAGGARWIAEPVKDRTFVKETVLGLLASMATYSRGVVTLHARLPPSARPHPELAPLAADLRSAMGAVAAALRSGQPVGHLPALRKAQLDLARRLGYSVRPEPTSTAGPVRPMPMAEAHVADPRAALADIGDIRDHAAEEQTDAEAAAGQAQQALVLVTETDLIVNSVDTLGYLLGLPS